MDHSTPEGRTALEREWVNADPRVTSNPNWALYRNIDRSYLYRYKRYVIWEFVDGKPRLIDLLRVKDIGISWQYGFEVVFESAAQDREYTVTALPREEFPGVFMWIPHFADVRFTPLQFADPASPKRLTIPICFRTRHSDTQAGGRNITEYKAFNKICPGIF